LTINSVPTMIKESMMTDIDYSGESEIVMNKVDNKPKNFSFSLFFCIYLVIMAKCLYKYVILGVFRCNIY